MKLPGSGLLLSDKKVHPLDFFCQHSVGSDGVHNTYFEIRSHNNANPTHNSFVANIDREALVSIHAQIGKYLATTAPKPKTNLFLLCNGVVYSSPLVSIEGPVRMSAYGLPVFRCITAKGGEVEYYIGKNPKGESVWSFGPDE